MSIIYEVSDITLRKNNCESRKGRYHGLVMLTFHFEATRRLFWDGTRNFEPRSDAERTTPKLAPPLQTFPPHQREGVWSPSYDLTGNRPNTRRILG
ncbi:hypothetical protein AVEN_24533-1 [Araneus ventricosus]|uniref:Uncharacterized protein n=1 Tax=Araneus ventricosus TaxID=182803 RepID=A0A4Y2X133_ARAVE|nr:hypothetical protein AVEN_95916-1 [Araneus ventricosus]GBO41767.1 hypothetical protein AVEN_24533-1 [Araneus ventricosus]